MAKSQWDDDDTNSITSKESARAQKDSFIGKAILRKGGVLTCVFLFFNILLCVMAISIMAFDIWMIIHDPSAFLNGTTIISYCVVVLGGAMFLLTLVGCVGGVLESMRWLYAYIITSLLIMAGHIGVFIGLYMEMQTVTNVITQAWTEMNVDMKVYIQSALSCCGLRNYTEYSSNPANITQASCFREDNGAYFIHEIGCSDAIHEYFSKKIWVFALAITLLISVEIVTYILSCLLLAKIDSSHNKRAREFRAKVIAMMAAKRWRRKAQNNKIAPKSDAGGFAMAAFSMKAKAPPPKPISRESTISEEEDRFPESSNFTPPPPDRLSPRWGGVKPLTDQPQPPSHGKLMTIAGSLLQFNQSYKRAHMNHL